jgi:preprotein translocase subunit SecA
LRTGITKRFGINIDDLDFQDLDRQEVADAITEVASKAYDEKESIMGAERLRFSERMIMLQLLDGQWKDHLLSMDHLKEGISLRSYGQRDPLVEYKKESFELFQNMMRRFEEETIRFMFYLQPSMGASQSAQRAAAPVGISEVKEDAPTPVAAGSAGTIEDFTRDVRRKKEKELSQARMAGAGDQSAEVKQVVRGKKVGRNDPCPCGSGKKHKKCCGRAA